MNFMRNIYCLVMLLTIGLVSCVGTVSDVAQTTKADVEVIELASVNAQAFEIELGNESFAYVFMNGGILENASAPGATPKVETNLYEDDGGLFYVRSNFQLEPDYLEYWYKQVGNENHLGTLSEVPIGDSRNIHFSSLKESVRSNECANMSDVDIGADLNSYLGGMNMKIPNSVTANYEYSDIGVRCSFNSNCTSCHKPNMNSNDSNLLGEHRKKWVWNSNKTLDV